MRMRRHAARKHSSPVPVNRQPLAEIGDAAAEGDPVCRRPQEATDAQCFPDTCSSLPPHVARLLKNRPSPRMKWGRAKPLGKVFKTFYLPGSMPLALITGKAAGAVRNRISALAASGSFAVALTAAVKTT